MTGGGAPLPFRLLLAALPADFRARHGDDLERHFVEALREARGRGGRLGAARVWVVYGWDVLRRAAYERFRRLRTRERGARAGFALVPDLRFAFRGFARQPGTTLLVVSMLALGIAANTTVFSLINGLFLRPLPFPESGRLVYLNETAPRWDLEFTGINYAHFDVWRRSARAFEAMALLNPDEVSLSDGRSAERVRVATVTHEAARVLGLEPVLGRTFTPEEDRPDAPRTVMLGHDLWRTRFDSSPGVLGSTLRVNGHEHTIVGVLPPEAEFPNGAQLWLPLRESVTEDHNYQYEGVGRLRPGVSVAGAEDDLFRAHGSIWEEQDTTRTVSPRVLPLRERLAGDYRLVAVALGAGVGLVLLIACANVASVLLARAAGRRREMAVRSALGAGRGRLARQLFAESLAVAVVAGPPGVLLGHAGLRLLLASMGDQVPEWMDFSLDARVALFGVAATLGTALLFGWAPLLQTRARDLGGALAHGGRAGAPAGQRRTLGMLVVAEVALAVMLLVGGGLLYQAFRRVQDVEPGFATTDVLTFRLALPPVVYDTREARIAFYRGLLDELRNLPGVEEAGSVSCLPLTCHWGRFYRAEGQAPPGPGEQSPVVLARLATPGYADAMGVRVLRGRFFEDSDGEGDVSRAVVVNESFARRFWPDQDPVGRRVSHGGDDDPWLTVVGLVRDVRHYGLDEPMRPGLYLPYGPEESWSMAVALRTSVPPTSLIPAVRDAVRRADPELPLIAVGTMEQALDRSLGVRRTYSAMLGVFAVLALALALGGLYGTLSYVVGQRRREIGIRMALGAQRPGVLRLVLAQGLLLVGAGLLLGLAGAVAAGRALSGLLFGVSATDPATYLGVAGIMLATAVLATLVPARRAVRVDPNIALRDD